MRASLLLAALTITSSLAFAHDHDKAAPRAFIIEPANNATVTSPVTVKFGLENMEVTPAGTENPNGGHHHLLIDTALPANLSLPIPADAQHVHFGKGQTETTLELAPGKHTLQLLVGDHLHRPHSTPVYSETITITVKEAEKQ
ncbi:DUF4399 domain-containing protein [Cellvibrio sp. pealriver]|uniref:DUF4399 domain-containing protein n=1 Tax=Cellvibrio sp. pealriver TaxID=1622269 RepID=UPI00066FDBF2|nr:DUF4399 domain-containing protein [Cellvibrio sp. pealriver]